MDHLGTEPLFDDLPDPADPRIPRDPFAELAEQEAQARARGAILPQAEDLEGDWLYDAAFDPDDAAPGYADTSGSAPAGPGEVDGEGESSASRAVEMSPVWSLLEDHEIELQMATLQVWVRWLVARYELETQVPPCWAGHPVAVDLFTALYERWAEVYVEAPRDGKRGYDMLAWLDTMESRVERLAGKLARCAGTHAGADAVGWVQDVDVDVDAVRTTMYPPVP